MPLRFETIVPLLRDVLVFDAFEIAPCRWEIDADEDIINYERLVESVVFAEDPAKVVWSVYGHFDATISNNRGVEHLCDCGDKLMAELIAKLLEDHRFCERRGL